MEITYIFENGILEVNFAINFKTFNKKFKNIESTLANLIDKKEINIIINPSIVIGPIKTPANTLDIKNVKEIVLK